jgi:hypothetical protein
MDNKFDTALHGMRAKLAEHLIHYGYQPEPTPSLKNPVPTSPAALVARVGAVILAVGFLAEEEARQIAWDAKDGKDFWPDLAALRSVTDTDLTALVRADKALASLDRDEIDMLAESARDAARTWAASHLGDALHEADRAYKEAAKATAE